MPRQSVCKGCPLDLTRERGAPAGQTGRTQRPARGSNSGRSAFRRGRLPSPAGILGEVGLSQESFPEEVSDQGVRSASEEEGDVCWRPEPRF